MSNRHPNDFPVDPYVVNGGVLAERLTRLVESLDTRESGYARPSYAQRGTIWLDESNIIGSPSTIKMMVFDGTHDVLLHEVNVDSGEVIGGGGVGGRAWDALQPYKTGDVVTEATFLYIAIQDSTGSAPSTHPLDWLLFDLPDYDGVIPYADIAALRDAPTGVGSVAYLSQDGRAGHFKWSEANHTADITADTQSGVYVAPSSDLTGASGAWVRQYSGAVNVRWFGAVGDDNKDDTVAIQAALDFRVPNDVYIPNGVYKITSTLILNNAVGVNTCSVYGEGKTAVLKGYFLSSDQYIFKSNYIDTGGVLTQGFSRLTLRGLSLESDGTGGAINATRIRYSSFEDLYIINFERGVLLDSSWGVNFANVNIWYCSRGIDFVETNNSNSFKHCYFYYCPSAIYNGGISTSFDSCIFEKNDIAFDFTLNNGPKGPVTIDCCYLEDNDIIFDMKGAYENVYTLTNSYIKNVAGTNNCFVRFKAGSLGNLRLTVENILVEGTKFTNNLFYCEAGATIDIGISIRLINIYSQSHSADIIPDDLYSCFNGGYPDFHNCYCDFPLLVLDPYLAANVTKESDHLFLRYESFPNFTNGTDRNAESCMIKGSGVIMSGSAASVFINFPWHITPEVNTIGEPFVARGVLQPSADFCTFCVRTDHIVALATPSGNASAYYSKSLGIDALKYMIRN